MDRVPADVRSANMSRIKQKDTTPELIVRRNLYKLGLRYRLYRKDLPGKPDLVFPSKQLAIFVHGCFWHRHNGCKLSATPKSNKDFWLKKFDANVRRDENVQKQLEALGWKSIVIWECETRDPEILDQFCQRIRKLIHGGHTIQRLENAFPASL